MAATGSTKAILAALIANAGIAIAKFAGFMITGAASMLAEAVHSVADTTNQALLLWGGRAAQKAPTSQHPFGYGRERYFWAFVVAVLLFTVGSLVALREGAHKLADPHPLTSPEWAMGILAFGVLLESYSFRTAIVAAREIKGSQGWWSFIRHSRNPELPVVLLEDLAALLGLGIAFTGVGLAAWTGDARFDAVGSLAVGVLLAVVAVVLAVEMKSLLIGEGASQADESRIRGLIESDETVLRLIHMRTQHIGPEEVLLAAKVEFASPMSVREIVDAINKIEERIRDELPVARVIYIEPDIVASDAHGGSVRSTDS